MCGAHKRAGGSGCGRGRTTLSIDLRPSYLAQGKAVSTLLLFTLLSCRGMSAWAPRQSERVDRGDAARLGGRANEKRSGREIGTGKSNRGKRDGPQVGGVLSARSTTAVQFLSLACLMGLDRRLASVSKTVLPMTSRVSQLGKVLRFWCCEVSRPIPRSKKGDGREE